MSQGIPPRLALISRIKLGRDALTPWVFVLLIFLTTAHAQVAAKEGITKPFKSVVISASMREIISQIHVEEGDKITEGQMLVDLQAEKQRLAVERYTQMLTKAQFDFNAAQRLYEQKVSSKDDALAKEVELKRLQAELGIAKAELTEREVRSPFNGVVVHKLKEAREAVNEVDPILQIMQTDQLLLLYYVEAPYLSVLKIGQELTVRFPELVPVVTRKAKVNFIDPEVDSRSGLFRVRLLLDNKDDALKPGLRVQADFPVLPVTKP